MPSQQYLIAIAVLLGINTIAALGLYFVVMTGQLSLGHGVIMSLGSYASAMLMIKLSVPFWLALPLSGIAGAMGGWLFAYILATRMKGMYLSIATTALASAIQIVYQNVPLMGGPLGLHSIPIHTSLTLVLVILVIVGVILHRFETSRLGISFRAMKGDVVAASAMGVDIRRTIMTAWVTSGFITGIAGALYASFTGVIGPQDFGFARSVLIVLPPFVGGVGSLWGTVVGSAVVVLVPEILRVQAADRFLLYGVFLLLLMLVRPRGLLGEKHRSLKLPWFGRQRRESLGTGE